MSLLKEAVRLNNEGVQGLLYGKYLDSIELFFNAVKALQAELDATDTEQPSPSIDLVPSSRQSCRSRNFKTFFLSPAYLPMVPETPSAKDWKDDTFIFSQAFEIPDVKTTEGISPGDISIYSSQVLFNLALAHHLLYMERSRNDVPNKTTNDEWRKRPYQSQYHSRHQENHQQGLLRKTEGLYNAAPNIRDDESCQAHTSCTCWIIQLASMTNWLQLVRSSRYTEGIVEYPINYHRTCEALRYLSTYHDELEGLFYHVLLFKGPTLAPAA